MSIEIISKRCMAFAFGIILIAAAWGVTSAQQTALTPVSQSPEIKAPAAGGLTMDKLKAMKSGAEASTDLSETDKNIAINHLEAGIRLLEETGSLVTELGKLSEAIAAAPQRINDIQTHLNASEPALSKVDIEAEASQMTTAKVEQREREVRADLTNVRAMLTGWREQLNDLRSKPAQLQREIAENKEKLVELGKELKKETPSNEHRELFRAKEAELLGEQSMRSAKVRLLEKQLLSNELMVSLMTAEMDLATMQQKRTESESSAWGTIASERRQKEAINARMQAETAKSRTPDLPPPIREQYEINIELGKSLEQFTQDDAVTERMLEQRQSELKLLEVELSRTRQRVQSAVLTEMSGITLRQRRQTLPNPLIYRQNSAQRQVAMGRASEAQFNTDELRRSLLNLEGARRRIIESIEDASPENRFDWEDSLHTVLTDRRNLLERLQTTIRRHYINLQSLELSEQQLALKTEEFAELLDRHLLWIRSSSVFGLKDLRNLPGAVMWMMSPRNWFQLLRDLGGSFRNSPIIFLLGLVSTGLLFIRREWARGRIDQLSKNVGRVGRDSFMATVQVFGLTLYLAIAWPIMPVLAGWRLAAYPNSTAFTFAASEGLLRAGFLWAVLLFMYNVCRDQGLAHKHFRWPDISRISLRHHLSWFMPLYLFSGFVADMTYTADRQLYADSLGRLMLVTAMAVFAVFAFKMLAAIVADTPSSRKDARTRRMPLRFIRYCLAIGLPSLFVIMAVMGYTYSAVYLKWLLHETLLLAIALILGNSLMLRWLFVTQRRFAYEEAIRKHKERLVSERAQNTDHVTTEGHQEMKSFEIEEREITQAQINDQTRSLLQMVLFSSAVLGLWAIWNDVMPALQAFKNVTLWTYSIEMDDATRVMPITLFNVMTATIVAVITFISVRNLPGVLEISLLKYLPMDTGSRFAFSTISKYIVSLVGIVIAFNHIGISWSNLKWLAAALSVGIGFGLQEIVANFISGLIILFERPIRVGDLVTVDNVDGAVTKIRIRATTLTTWDRKEYIVPNKEFITGRLMNWTLSNPINRVVIAVGIAYGSDTEKARELLLKVAREHPLVLEDPAPVAAFHGFGDNALNFVLRCFLPNFDNWANNKTELHLAIDKAFREAGITIAFPQRDIHIHSADGSPAPLSTPAGKQPPDVSGDRGKTIDAEDEKTKRE